MAIFAKRFVKGRLAEFDKDMRICLRPFATNGSTRPAHAYFPALAACCGMREYLTALSRGNLHGIGWTQVAGWAERFLPQPDYNRDTVHVLFEAFRHPIAHRGIASGVWVDRRPHARNARRVTWKLLANAKRPACDIVEEHGELKRDPPWPCPYTHRARIHHRSLWIDIQGAAKGFTTAIGADEPLRGNFEACMRQLYPL